MTHFPQRQALCLTPIAAAAALLFATSAWAQQAEPAEAADTAAVEGTVPSVVVTGMRASLESALNAKRNDNGIVDVIKQMLKESLQATVTRQIGYLLSRSAYAEFRKNQPETSPVSASLPYESSV